MIWRAALVLLPELQHIGRGILMLIFGLVILIAPVIGLHSQPWSPWWMSNRQTELPPGTVPERATAAPEGPTLADAGDLMATIQPWMGTPYLFGGTTLRGVDCSAFVQNVARALGLSLPRTAQAQFNATERVSDPRPGDLVFFERTYSSPDRITHVGWYVGDGWMISAIEPRLGRQSLSDPFWRSRIAGYGRIRRSPPNQA